MNKSTIAIILVLLTVVTWTIDTGPLNFLWLVMLVVDFWAIIALVGYEMILGIVKAIKQ